ncbi:cytochrome P450 [Streptomyces niveiscabiei]|uniref:cytochrome P450 n=1 Tax=Streptomyces niveiscabiei TaxID=164115 RepID=UPI0029B82781|nr:cytochrome P450 [Streptomyces niveiscabiei]MDX3387456.1 cytochrome P450 [Streptomyces niveiscabiei]
MAVSDAAPLRPVAGPRRLPVLGNLLSFGRDPLDFMVRLREDHGDFVTWSLGPQRCVLLSHPQHIAALLAADGSDFERSDVGWTISQVTGNSVAAARGEQWRRKRTKVQAAVRPRQVRAYAATMASHAGAHAGQWRDGQRIDVLEEMTGITQGIINRTLFGDTPQAHGRDLRAAMATVEHELAAAVLRGIDLFLPGWVRTPSRKRLLAALSVIDAVIYRLIQERRANPGDRRQDVLDMLLAERDEQGRPLTDTEVRDEAVTLWIAGHETTAAALTWTWLELSGAARTRSRLSEELHRVLGGRTPTHEDYDRLPYTQQVVKEALRLYPPIWTLSMTALHDTALAGIPIPARTLVWCSQWSVHRDPRWFPDPQTFQPERFAVGSPVSATDHAWFPFGTGPRACLGARLAQVQVVLVLAALAQRFHLDVDPGRIAPLPGAILRPAAPVLATVRALR